MTTIYIHSLTDSIKLNWYGVGAAHEEHLNLMKNNLSNTFKTDSNNLIDADIVHYHTLSPHHYLFLPFLRKTKLLVAHVHFLPETFKGGVDLPKILRPLWDKYIVSFYKYMDYLIVVNPYYKKVLKDYGIDEKKLIYIPHSVSTKTFFRLSPGARAKLRKKYGYTQQDFVVLGVGQLQSRKGVIDFINIAKKLKKIKFVWAGDFAFGKRTSGYKEIKSAMQNLPKNLRFLGSVDRSQMNDIYNLADLFFHPSYHEIFGLAVLEAYHCGLPVLLRDLEVYRDVFKDSYAMGSTNTEFANQIDRLSANIGYYNRLRTKSWRQRALYSEENIVLKWKNFYHQLAQKIKI